MTKFYLDSIMGVSTQTTETSKTVSRIFFGATVIFAVGMAVSLFTMKKSNDNQERESPAKGGTRRTHRMHRANHGTRRQ
jgi:hypothetical protein